MVIKTKVDTEEETKGKREIIWRHAFQQNPVNNKTQHFLSFQLPAKTDTNAQPMATPFQQTAIATSQ